MSFDWKTQKKVLEYVAPPLRCWWSMPSLFPPYGYSQMFMLVLWSLSKNARSLFEIIYGQARNKMQEQESIGKIVVVNKVKASCDLKDGMATSLLCKWVMMALEPK
jgi:hypothetical protein